MATPTDPTFGAGFNATEFRNAITQTMLMGMPEEAAEQATFMWTVDRTYPIHDPAGDPYDFTATPTSTVAPPEMIVPCAVQVSTRGSLMDGTAMGEFNHQKLTITILDTDYEDVSDADLVRFGDSLYNIDFWEPVIGLFSVSVYAVHCTSLDEA